MVRRDLKSHHHHLGASVAMYFKQSDKHSLVKVRTKVPRILGYVLSTPYT